MRIGTWVILAAALCGAGVSVPARAGPATESLGRCLVETSTEADRAALMRWSFVVFAVHPRVQDLVAVSDARREEIVRTAGQSFSRLIIVDCRRETIAALRADGPASIEAAFEHFGQVTTVDLLNSPAGAQVLGDIGRHMDVQAFEALAAEAAAMSSPVT